MSGDLISRKAIVRELLIERDKYPVYTEERYSLGVKIVDRFNAAMRGGIRKALRIVETAPAVDAEPVRHGRWIITFCGGADYTRTTPFRYRCSECGLYSDNKYPYCHCGAKLDLEETE